MGNGGLKPQACRIGVCVCVCGKLSIKAWNWGRGDHSLIGTLKSLLGKGEGQLDHGNSPQAWQTPKSSMGSFSRNAHFWGRGERSMAAP